MVPGTMEAGTSMDKLIAELVFNLIVVRDPVNHRGYAVGHGGPDGKDLPFYSQDMSPAWTVLQKLGLWVGQFTEGEYWAFDSMTAYMEGNVSRAPTGPLAICREAIRLTLRR